MRDIDFMDNFFRGWRQRTGLVLFLFTLESATFWVRSYWFTDWVSLGHAVGFVDVISQQGHFSWNYNFSPDGYVSFAWDRLHFDEDEQVRLIHYDNVTPFWMITIAGAIASLGLILWTPRNDRAKASN